MYQRGFYIPNYPPIGFNPVGLAPQIGITPPKVGLLGKIGNTFKGFNFGSLLSNANKTLNVVNQAIPLVKQAGPMFNNMRSMIKVASLFKDETETNKKENNKNVDTNNNYQNNFNNPSFFL